MAICAVTNSILPATAPEGTRCLRNVSPNGASDTIVPRLHAAEADCGRVHIVSAVRDDTELARGFDLQRDLASLEDLIAELGDVVAVAIDPISAYLGRGIDSHKNAEVRSVLEPLAQMAERTGIAVLTVTHLSKNGVGSAINRFLGSIRLCGRAANGIRRRRRPVR
jgi:hypothetical protein